MKQKHINTKIKNREIITNLSGIYFWMESTTLVDYEYYYYYYYSCIGNGYKSIKLYLLFLWICIIIYTIYEICKGYYKLYIEREPD